MTDMQTLSTEQIEKRLAEINKLDEAHRARDMDAELASAIRGGGDVDALEAIQLQAEREARRLRAERIALEAEFPLAKAQEGAARLSQIEADHGALAEPALDAARRLVDAWSEVEAAIDQWLDAQHRAEQLTNQAEATARASGAEMPLLGTFKCSAVVEIGRAHNRAEQRFGAAIWRAEHGQSVGGRVHCRVLEV